MNTPRILIAGVGNIFMADDAFGCEVAKRLSQRAMPAGVRVVDFGIRSLDLTYAMLEGYDAVILIDAAPRGRAPGTLYVIEPSAPESNDNVMLDGHGMDVVKVMQAATAMGAKVGQVLLVGCEPTPRDAGADWEMNISPPVQAALEEAVAIVQTLVAKIIGNDCPVGSTHNGGSDHEPLDSKRIDELARCR
jgi:hydrogenase maturation protease